MFPGFGTLVNVVTVVLGAGIGLLLGHRLPARTRATVTDALGLVTLLAAPSAHWFGGGPGSALSKASSRPRWSSASVR